MRYVVFDTREIDIFVNTTNARTQVHHRTGIVPVRETSIVIAVSSAHRKESLEAVHYLIDTIKATVPIWKKEIYSDGTSWKANAESRSDAVVGKKLFGEGDKK